MIKITKTQRDQLISVAIGAVGVVAALWYFVVTAQYKELAVTNSNSAKMMVRLKEASAKVKDADVVAQKLTNCLEQLKQREANFAPEREPYSWMVDVMSHFYLPADDVHRYKTVSNIDFKQPEISDKGVLANFPYKWARFHITGEGHYHDLGKFIANFENAFPYFAIQNLDIAVPNLRQAQDPEMLAFTFDIVTPQLSGGTDTK